MRRRWRILFWFISTFLLLSLLPLLVLGVDAYKNYFSVLSGITWYAASWNAASMAFLPESWVVPKMSPWSISRKWLAWPTPQESSPDSFDLGFSLTIIGMLLISPLGWMYYFSLLIIPAAVAWRLVRRLASRTRYKTIIMVAWILSTVPHFLMPSADMGAPLIWFTWAGFYFYSLLWFSFILGSLAHRLKKAPHAANPI